jgi:peptide/nickel transport system substrate-binding protein
MRRLVTPRGPRALWVLLLATPILAACGDDGDNEGDNGSTLVVGVETLGGENWSPWLSSGAEDAVMDLVGDSLVTVDPETRELMPGLAESWELSDDNLTWTFRLRPDVPFHDDWGTVTAEDVKFSYEQLIREDSIVPRAGVFSAAVDGDISNFEVVSELEFKIHSPTPMVTLPSHLVNVQDSLTVTSKDYWDEVGEEEAGAHPIGTGPFKYVSQQRNVEVRLEAVDDHWRHTPAYDNLVIKVVPDEGARLAQVRAGDIDLTQVSVGPKEEAEGAGLSIFSVPSIGLSSVMLGGQYPGDDKSYDADAPWIQADNLEAGRAVREALSVALDRDAIVTNLLNGEGAPAAAPIVYVPGDFPFVDPSWEVPPYDPDRARELLAEGGYPDGFALKMPLFPQDGRASAVPIAEAVAAMWEEIGIDVELQPMEFSPTFRQQLIDRTTAGSAYQYTIQFYDEPVDHLAVAYSPTSAVAHMYDPAIEAGIDAMNTEPNRDARMALARALGSQLIEDVRAIPVASVNGTYIASSKVDEWDFVTGTGTLNAVETVTLN